ncbi:MAG TPA: ATP-binding protein [Burkholderiales bacterium]|nr:ATP-binding protein [Burkholderiales bacterium]
MFRVSHFAGVQRLLSNGVRASSAVDWLRVLFLVSAAVPAMVFALLAWEDYVRAIDDVRQHAEQIALAAEEHALKVLETSEVILRRTRDLLGDRSDEAIWGSERDLHLKLQHISEGLPQVHSTIGWNREGRPLAADRFYPVPRDLSVADRDYFIVQANGGTDTFISAPYKGRIDGYSFFSISRPRASASREFTGVVTVSLSPEYFASFYRDLSAAHHGTLSVTLLKPDGKVIARYPAPLHASIANGILMRAMSRSEPSGTVTRTAEIDGRIGLVVFRKVARYPVYVVAGTPYSSILAQWGRTLALWAPFALLAALSLMLMSWMALRRTKREQEAVHQWHEEVARRSLAEAELRQAQKLETIGQLTGGLAHDFNNLLGVIRNNVHVLKHKQAAGDCSPHFAAIEKAIAGGQNLTQRLLAFSRREPLQKRAIDLVAVLSNVGILLKHSLPSNIQLHCDVAAGTGTVEADARELESALLNMALNSRDAMPHGGVLTIRACNALTMPGEALEGNAEPGKFVAVSVTDTGQGIPDEILPRVFDPFFTTKPAGKGTGLGLSQVYDFAKQSGGNVTVKSEALRGTTITLYLPRCDQPAQAIVQIRKTLPSSRESDAKTYSSRTQG